jgi:hypothetical protein
MRATISRNLPVRTGDAVRMTISSQPAREIDGIHFRSQ